MMHFRLPSLRRSLFWPSLAAFLLAAGFVIVQPGSIAKDAGEYDRLAESVLRGRYELDGAPSMLREPGYPVFRAAVKVFNDHPASILWIQSLLFAFSVVLVGSASRRLMPEAGSLPAWAAACSYGLAVYASRHLLEILTAFLLSLVGWLFIRATETEARPTWRWLLVVASAALLFTRFSFIFVPVTLFVCLAVLEARRLRAWKKPLVSAAVSMATVGLLLAPWVVRNGMTFGSWGVAGRTGIQIAARAYKAEASWSRFGASASSVFVGRTWLATLVPGASPIFLEQWKDVWARVAETRSRADSDQAADALLKAESMARILATPGTFFRAGLWSAVDTGRLLALPSPMSPEFSIESMFIAQSEAGTVTWKHLAVAAFAFLLQLLWWIGIAAGTVVGFRRFGFRFVPGILLFATVAAHLPADDIVRYAAPIYPWIAFIFIMPIILKSGTWDANVNRFNEEGVSRPMYKRSIDSNLIEAANLAYHEAEAGLYDASHPEIIWCERLHWDDFAVRHVDSRPRPISILDIGAGTGFVGSVLKGHLHQGDRYVATDISPEMLEILKKNLEGCPCDVTTAIASADRLPSPERAFDIVVVNSAMHHFPDPEKCLEEAARVTKPGGIVVVMHEPNLAFASSPFSRLVASLSSVIAARIDVRKGNAVRPDYTSVFAHVNDRLMSGGFITEPLSRPEIQGLVDVHSPTARGRYEAVGFDVRTWLAGALSGWKLVRFETYNHLGKLDPNAFTWRRVIERVLGTFRPRKGSLFSFIARKPGRCNVFMTCDTYLPDIGGAEIHVFELQKRLREMGHSVTLFVTNPKPSTEDERYPVIREQWSLSRTPRLLRRIWIASKDAEIYHSHYCHKLAMLTGVVARVRRKPFFITLHGLGILDHPGTPWIYDKAHRFYRWTSLHLATGIISTSEDLAMVCRRYLPDERIHVIPNGLDTSAFDPSRIVPSADPRFSDASPLILTVRRLVPKNGIHYAVSAMPHLLRRYPKAKLVMVGDGRMREAIQERARRLGVEHACVFLGSVPNREIAPIAMRADVVLFPSTAESTSIACAEMMSLGKRIVASRVGGLIELLGTDEERGWLMKLVPWESCDYDAPDELPEDRYRALADRVMDAYTSSEGTRKTDAARRYAMEELDWSVIVRKTLETYRSFLADS
ncbi:glycosyltransferase [Patescibacteria group bacterium]|nr:glycosyltransferase [Patescibacteria group bacterium]